MKTILVDINTETDLCEKCQYKGTFLTKKQDKKYCKIFEGTKLEIDESGQPIRLSCCKNAEI